MTDEKSSLYATFFKTLGNSTRLKIILLLAEKDLCVGEIESHLNLDMSVISRHLKQLHENSIVSATRQGKNVVYKLEMRCILSFIDCVDTGLTKECSTC